LKFATKSGITNGIRQIKYPEYPGSETYVTVEDDDDLELAMAVVMSASEASTRTITFVIQFEKDLPTIPSLEEEQTEATRASEVSEDEERQINTCASVQN